MERDYMDKWTIDPLLLAAPKIYTFPSSKNFHTEYESDWDSIKNKHDDLLDAAYIADIMKNLSSQIGIPMTSALNSSITSKYPIKYTQYTEYDVESTIGLPPIAIIQWSNLLEEIDKLDELCIPVFIAQTRNIRNNEGDMCDPWGRSIPMYRNNFVCQHLRRRETEINANHSKEILAWLIETSVCGERVGLVLWEQVQVSIFARQSAKNSLVDWLHPHKTKIDPSYVI